MITVIVAVLLFALVHADNKNLLEGKADNNPRANPGEN